MRLLMGWIGVLGKAGKMAVSVQNRRFIMVYYGYFYFYQTFYQTFYVMLHSGSRAVA